MLKTKIIKIDEKNINNPEELGKLREAAGIIKNGGLVVFPTETVYGLGADALNRNAVGKIYKAKGRPSDNPLIVHFSNAGDIYKYAEVNETAGKIINKFMPAPLTLVLKKKNGLLNYASPNLDTVAVRVPRNKTARKLIELAGTPIAAPSANLSGKPSPTSAEHIISDLNGRADMIICGESSEIGLESTVISFNPDNPDNGINILRSGFITREMLSEFNISENNLSENNNKNNPPVCPGIKYRHYSPDAPLRILSGENHRIIDFIKRENINNKNKKIGFLCFDELSEYFDKSENIAVISLGPRDNLNEQAKNLFGALNKFNNIGVDIIYSIEPSRKEIGEAVYNRLMKASGGKVCGV
ncbi:MAG: L-threonylcarbamoyladenylate synthase [Oscillospiraceae bacterium]|nr:L-threonylcarbamoyladenylate synthase [Oscillospiraceae bacterium]